MKVTHPFEPIYDENSKMLILGSFPSVKSREQNFYYGHPQNRFWRLLAKIFLEEIPSTIQEKTEFVLKHHVALWDVISSCEIKGSSDASITDAVVNDIENLLEHTKIDTIYFNGKTAYQCFKNVYQDSLDKKVTLVVLPSTSSANASYQFNKLYEVWKQIVKNR